MEDYRAALKRQVEELDRETGRAAARFLPDYERRLAHHSARGAATRNPIARAYHRILAAHCARLVGQARRDVEAAARAARPGTGLLPRR